MDIGRKKKRLGDMLLKEQIITQEQLERALGIQKDSHKKLGEVLIDLGYTTEEAIAVALSRQLGVEKVSLNGMNIDKEIINLVSGNILRKYVMIPFEYSNGNMNEVRMAMADPMDMLALDDFTIITNLQVDPVTATPTEIMLALDKYYGNSEALNASKQYMKEREELESVQTPEQEQYNEDVNNSPIVLLVKTMIEQAARQRASDIHIEALEQKVRIRFRIDGALYEKFSYNIQMLPAIIARVKIIGGMDISEKRKPQDGSLSMLIDRKEYDIRASILPTVHGEKCVMRLAQKKALNKGKKELGFSEDEMVVFEHILMNPNGMILVTGPTGSGKSTTLYTALNELNREDVNIITVEDPVESILDGVNQVQVNAKADLTFATALRSILRQDPDIIMIGEIRDRETAEIAVQASMTGHLVVSTLHTNSAASTLTRLLDMGIESYLLSDSMIGVIAQRLVRRLCPHCKKVRLAQNREKEFLGLPIEEAFELYEPAGCPMCSETGYFGRTGIYELMKITPDLREIISDSGSADEIKKQALKDGMSTLKMSAMRLVKEGTTSFGEMLRVSFEN
ncbi:MAG: ATPase, T2SS/T4P/T4SS family [Lachnospiraceae bacterium]